MVSRAPKPKTILLCLQPDKGSSLMSEKYSFSLTTFSPSGKLGQIEYAIKTVSEGSSCLGIRVKSGVVLVAEKFIPPLADPASYEKVAVVSSACGITYSGLGPDFNVLCRESRKTSETYKGVYGEHPNATVLAKKIANVMQEYTQSGGVRPFGISCLFAGISSKNTASLYQIDPAGSSFEWKATAIGKNALNRQSFLEKRYLFEMSLEDTISTGLLAMKDQFEGRMTSENTEVGVFSVSNNMFRKLTVPEIEDYISSI